MSEPIVESITSLRQKISDANQESGPPKSDAATPRRNWTFEPKIPGVDRTVREPNPGFNSDPEYTAASKAAYEFQTTEMADYDIALADYQRDLALHSSNVKQGIASEAPIAPIRPTPPIEAKVIRQPNEARRWYKALGRAQAIRTTRTGLDKQASGVRNTDARASVLSSDELIKRQEAAAERRKQQRGVL